WRKERRMLQLTNEHVDSIIKRISFLKTEAGDLPKFRDMSQFDYMENRDQRRSLERLVENVVNIMVDICKILLSAADVPIPDTYKTIVLQAGAQGIIPRALAEAVSEWSGLRNALAHQYLDIRWDSLSRFINSGPTVSSQFVDAIEKILPTASSPGAS
ncbi:MAG: DUF86 domain-containing protein, partial [Bacillota bacterium]